MIIDCHAHVFAFPKLASPFSKTTWLSAQEQIRIMDSKGVDKAVILPLSNAECCAEVQSFGEILYICECFPGRFIPYCNIDPRLPQRPDLITVDHFLYILEQYKNLGAKGLGELVARIPWNDPCMLNLLEACQIVNFPITFHTITPDYDGYGVLDYPGLELLEIVLKRFPHLRLFGHSPGFWSEISSSLRIEDKNGYPKGPVKEGGALVNLLRKYPNLHCDISAGSGLFALQRDPDFTWKFIEEFQDRIILGLDYGSVKNDMQHIEWLKKAKLENYISELAYTKITSRNISTILGLGL